MQFPGKKIGCEIINRTVSCMHNLADILQFIVDGFDEACLNLPESIS